MNREANLNTEDSIAIIGMNGRFPGAKNIEEFWQNIKNGKESIIPLTDNQLLAIGVDKAVINDTNYVKAGAFLEDIDLFDANFFGYNPQEASAIDPQHRIFLECAYSALENAGYNPENSSFGIGGTNAHVVLEETPDIVGAKVGSPLQKLLVISAKTETALEKATDNLVEHLNSHPELDLTDTAYTLQVGRKEFNYRRMVVGENIADVAIALQSREPQRVFTDVIQQQHHSIVFMFPGQGSQYVNMGKELYETEPVFREWIDRCSILLEPELGLDLPSLIYSNDEELDTATEKLKQTEIAQPAIFTIEYALAQLCISWGIKPQAAIGHSIGEYVAATIAGVMSLEDALRLVARRGKLIRQMPTGSMLAVSLSEIEVKKFLDDELSLAASNAPNLSVISGSDEAIARIETELNEKGIECRHLYTSHAFHSPMMDNAIAPLAQEVAKVKLNRELRETVGFLKARSLPE